MTIETKFNIGDEVWFMHNNKPLKVNIRVVNFSFETKASIKYLVSSKNQKINDEYSIFVWEKDLFPSKQDLLNSL